MLVSRVARRIFLPADADARWVVMVGFRQLYRALPPHAPVSIRKAKSALATVEISMRLASRKYCRYRRLMRSFSLWYFRTVMCLVGSYGLRGLRRVPL